MATILSPHHMGEVLVAELLRKLGNSIADIQAVDPRSGTKGPIQQLIPTVAGGAPCSLRPNASLEPLPTGVSFDGMHDIDCAVEYEASVVALELKLGATRLAPGEFKERFAEKVPRLTHGGRRLSGSMVAILDRNGACVDTQQLALRCAGKAVEQKWALVVMRQTMDLWAKNGASMALSLGVQNIAAIVTLEDVAEAVGIEEAKRVAVSLITNSVDGWFR